MNLDDDAGRSLQRWFSPRAETQGELSENDTIYRVCWRRLLVKQHPVEIERHSIRSLH